MKIITIILFAVSLSGWGLYGYSFFSRPAVEHTIAEKVAIQLEYKRALEDSLKQEVEMRKRNALFLKEQEFEHRLEESAAQFREQARKEMDGWLVAARDDTVKRQEELSKSMEEFGKKTHDSLSAFRQDITLELLKKIPRDEHSSQMLELRHLLDDAGKAVQSLKEGVSAGEREISGLKAARETDQGEIARLAARLKEQNAEIVRLRAEIESLRKAPVVVESPKEISK